MNLDLKIWNQALKTRANCMEEGIPVSRTILMRDLECSEHRARFIEACFKNMHIIGKGSVADNIRMTRQANQSKAELRKANTEIVRLTKIADLAENLGSNSLDPPKWLNPTVAKDDRCVISASLSDCHFDEVINPAEVNFINEYNRKIATARLHKYFDSIIRLCRDYMTGMIFDGFVFNILGDIVSGIIHDELQQTNDYPMAETIFYYAELIAAGMKLVQRALGIPVLAVCVVGNHGRFTPKRKFKGYVQDNYDYMLYQLLALHLKKCKDITVYIPLSTDAFYSVYSTRICATHGNAWGGGQGWMGMLGPIMRGNRKKQEKWAKMKLPYDQMVCGHWHQYFPSPTFTVNGSMIGYNEFASVLDFAPEEPKQALWLTDPRKGPTIHAPVHCKLKDEKWPMTEEHGGYSPFQVFDNGR